MSTGEEVHNLLHLCSRSLVCEPTPVWQQCSCVSTVVRLSWYMILSVPCSYSSFVYVCKFSRLCDFLRPNSNSFCYASWETPLLQAPVAFWEVRENGFHFRLTSILLFFPSEGVQKCWEFLMIHSFIWGWSCWCLSLASLTQCEEKSVKDGHKTRYRKKANKLELINWMYNEII